MMHRILIAFTLLAASTVAESAYGQFTQQNRVQNFSGSRFVYNYTARGSILNRPTTSPYLAMTDISGRGINSAQSYFTQVRPQLENQIRQRRQQRNINNLQRNVSSINTAISRAAANNRRGARITGHPTRFATYLNYYPGFGLRR